MMRKGLKNKKLATLEQWILYGKKMRLFIVFLGQKVLDLTDFLDSHPGGYKAIQPYRHKDISKILYQVYPHPPHVKSILTFYYIGQLCSSNVNQQQFLNLTLVNSPLNKKQQNKSSILKIRNMNKQGINNEEQKKQVEFASKHNKVYNLQRQSNQDHWRQGNQQMSINSLSTAEKQYIKSQQLETLHEFNIQTQHNKYVHKFEANFSRK